MASLLDTRERLNAELDVRAPRTETTVAAGSRFVLSPKTGFVFDFRKTGLEFAEGTFFDGVPLSQALNSTTKTIEGGLEVYLTPLTTFAVTASQQTDRFDGSPERDSDTFQDPAVDSPGGARHRSGLPLGRLPPLLGARA